MLTSGAVRVGWQLSPRPGRLLAFRRWRQDSPFPIQGWPALVDVEDFIDDLYWQLDCTVELDAAPGLPQDQRAAIDAVIRRFCASANRNFYRLGTPISGFARDPRQKRDPAETPVLRGSMSLGVAQDLLVLLCERLPVLARTHGSIRGVKLTGERKAYRLEPDSSD